MLLIFSHFDIIMAAQVGNTKELMALYLAMWLGRPAQTLIKRQIYMYVLGITQYASQAVTVSQ